MDIRGISSVEEREAKRFEIYLKSSSVKAFMRKRLISNSVKEALEERNREKKCVRSAKL